MSIDKAGSDLRLGAALPLGVAVEPGARLILGETTIDARYEVCFPDGCRAMATLPADQLGPLGEAASIELRFFAFGQEKPIAVEIPLDGLTEAVAAAQTQLAATP
jgi:invasion protein IalB